MKGYIVASCWIALLSSCLAAAQGAATYRWQDKDGVVHLTDDPKLLPPGYPGVSRGSAFPEVDPAGRGSAKPPAATAEAPGASATYAVTSGKGSEPKVKPDLRESAVRELQSLREALPEKKRALARLRHKWAVAKGRVPTEEEIRAFEKKRARGEATFGDNPYASKSPLTSSGRARQEYFKKLAEVQLDEERICELERPLDRPAGEIR